MQEKWYGNFKIWQVLFSDTCWFWIFSILKSNNGSRIQKAFRFRKFIGTFYRRIKSLNKINFLNVMSDGSMPTKRKNLLTYNFFSFPLDHILKDKLRRSRRNHNKVTEHPILCSCKFLNFGKVCCIETFGTIFFKALIQSSFVERHNNPFLDGHH